MCSRTSVRKMVVLLGIVAVLLAGCAAAAVGLNPAPVHEDPSNVQDPVVTPERPEYDHRSVGLGEVFELTIGANATTGYTWEVAEIGEGIVQLTSSEYVADPNPEQLCGEGAERVFRFEAVGKGETIIKLVYHRSWEKDVEPLRTYTVAVSVS